MTIEDSIKYNDMMDLKNRLEKLGLECHGLNLQIYKMVAQENGDCAGSTVEDIEEEIQVELELRRSVFNVTPAR